MHVRLVRVGLCTLASLCVAGVLAPLEGQEPALLKKRADSIAVLYRQVDTAWRALRRADSLRMLSELPVEPDQRLMRVSGLALVADSSLAEIAESAATRALQQIVDIYGNTPTTDAIANEQWYVNLDTLGEGTIRKKGELLAFSFRIFGERGRTLKEGGSTAPRARNDLVTIFRRRADDVMLHSMDSVATRWAGRTLGAGENTNLMYESIFRELAIGQHENALECYRRNLAACRSALAMERGDSVFRYRHLLNSSARAALLRLAVDSGGSGAFTRFMADTNSSIAQRLESAAGMPIDSLVERWLARAYKSRPQPASTSLPTALMALVWGSLLCAISLRSSRWR